MDTNNNSFSVNESSFKQPAPAPKKKKSKGWIGFLIFLLIVVVLPIATFFGLFFDPTRNPINVDPDLEINEMFSSSLVDSLENTTDPGDERVDFVITQDDLNQLLYAVTSSSGDVQKYIPQLDVKIDGENYDFYVNLSFGFFKSKVIIKTLISEDDVNNAFVFQIKDIALCRLQGLLSFTASIVSNYITDEYIEDIIDDYLSMDISIKDRLITYPEANLISDIQNLTNLGDSESTSLYFSIISELLGKNVLDFDFDGQLQAKLVLTDLMDNDYIDGGYNLNLTTVLDAASDDTESKMEDGTIVATDSAAIKTNFDTYFNNNSGIPPSDDPATIMMTHIPDFSSYTLPQIASFKSSPDPTLSYITEAELNGYLATIDFIGTTFIVSAYIDEVATVQYITIDNLYCNFVSNLEGDFIYFNIGLNINGCQTNVVFVTEYDSTAPSSGSTVAMKFITRQILYGEIVIFDSSETTISEAEGQLVSALFDLVAAALAGNSTMTIDKDDFSINIEFAFDAVVQTAINLLNSTAPVGSAVPDFYADDQVNSNVGKLKVVWQND